MPGIKADFVGPLESRHLCALCELVVRLPMQTSCGHIFCADCLKEAMSDAHGEKILCPTDSEEISQMFPDNACRREVQKLKVRCRYAKNNGCPWTGILSNEEVHYIVCAYRDEQCPDCGDYMMWTELKKHRKLECPMRLTVCRHCSELVPVSCEKLHIQKDCPAVELLCPNNCNPNRVMKRNELHKHLSAEDGDCPFSEVDCPYKSLGCSFTGVRSLLTKHFQENEICHHRLLVKSAIGTDVRQQNFHAAEVIHILESQLSNIDSRVTNLEKQCISNAQCLEYPANDNLYRLQRIVPELLTKQEEMSKAVEKLMTSSVDQELRLQLLEEATYNGILVWKIDEVSRRMDEAVKGITVSLFSPPFYTDPRGYKMCARCYLNGYGVGEGTHFSLFFVVMRGPYDALLRWPFQQCITMTLLNQSGGQHASSTFHPDVKVPSFQRPLNGDMNVPIGSPKLIYLEDLYPKGFVKEDTIFVRVVVDCLDSYCTPTNTCSVVPD